METYNKKEMENSRAICNKVVIFLCSDLLKNIFSAFIYIKISNTDAVGFTVQLQAK